MRGAQGSLNYILDTIPAVHSLEPYLSLLKVDGKLLLVGATKPLQFDPVSVMLGVYNLFFCLGSFTFIWA